MTKTVIQLFARPPVRGKVKTRLITTIGADQALAIYRHCLDYNLSLIRHSGFDYQVWLSEQPGQDWPDTEPFMIQQGASLGDRMLFALTSALSCNHGHYDRVILIGSDCLELTPNLLNAVNRNLDDHELVIIPAEDGGYALIGLRRTDVRLFQGIAWGASDVLARTRRIIDQLGWSCHELPMQWDLDRPGDIDRLLALDPDHAWVPASVAVKSRGSGKTAPGR